MKYMNMQFINTTSNNVKRTVGRNSVVNNAAKKQFFSLIPQTIFTAQMVSLRREVSW